jgi:hypothetical protein
MQLCHELGHVLHAYLSGGRVQAVILHPLVISFTDVRPNPEPLFVAWGGAIWGVLLPLALWLGGHFVVPERAWVLRFFAGFCLIANGVYLAAAIWEPAGDARTLLNHGAPLWLLAVVGTTTAATGLWCWNGLGHNFGWKRSNGQIDTVVAWTTATLLIITIGVELGLSTR